MSLNAVLTLMEQEVVSAADAMPAEKYDFASSRYCLRFELSS